MEQKTAGADKQIATESDQEDLVMSISTAAEDTLDAQPHEEQVGQGVDDLGRVNGGIVVLGGVSSCSLAETGTDHGRHTSSHQLSVEVTGLQNPALAGGYGMKGKDRCIVMQWSESEENVDRGGSRRRRKQRRPAHMTSITHAAQLAAVDWLVRGSVGCRGWLR